MKLTKSTFFMYSAMFFMMMGIMFVCLSIFAKVINDLDLRDFFAWGWIVCAPTAIISMYFYNKYDTGLDTNE
ncbi:hypothetical protein ABH307_00500 [Acinetobacter pittii]|uniref:hypothetical protein n=1 Tax=Acinetobacter pittii TaxID=48296 RepID=UPI0032619C9D